MRIAVLETSPHGGLLHYAAQLADGLARRGHCVDLIASRPNELWGWPAEFQMRAVLPRTVRKIEPPRSRISYQLRRVGVGARLTASWLRAVHMTRTSSYDAVIVNADINPLPAALGVLAMLTGPRPVMAGVCHNVRGFNVRSSSRSGTDLFGSSTTRRRLLGRAFQRFDVVFVHGERSRREFADVWPPSRLAVIPHGDERLFGTEPPASAVEERILFFGDWRNVKGLPVLMAAFDVLVGRRPSVRLTIAGTPAPADVDPEPIRRWAASHHGRVEVIDHYVPLEDVAALFGRARVVTTPYLVGYQSGVLSLAMTMARAVVTTDVGELGSTVRDGETGRVVAPGDAEALAVALEAVVADPALAERMGLEGRRRLLASASWERVAELAEAALVDAARLRAQSGMTRRPS